MKSRVLLVNASLRPRPRRTSPPGTQHATPRACRMSAAAGTRLRSARREGRPSPGADPAEVPFCGKPEPVPTHGGGVPATCLADSLDREREEGAFECNICLDLAIEPVVTQCGHLYCWACMYKYVADTRRRFNGSGWDDTPVHPNRETPIL